MYSGEGGRVSFEVRNCPAQHPPTVAEQPHEVEHAETAGTPQRQVANNQGAADEQGEDR